MKSLFFLSIAFAFSATTYAAIVETKFKVTTRMYDEAGETRKLLGSRAFVRYNNSVSITSERAKDDCLVMSGKKDLFSLFSEGEKAECLSDRTYVITTNDIIVDMFYRPATFDPFHDDATTISDILVSGGKITNETAADVGRLGGLRALIRNAFSQATETQTISLIHRTIFTLKGNGRAKVVMELEPVETKVLSN